MSFAPQPGSSPPVVPALPYLQRWRRLSRAAWLYLLHAALLTASLAIVRLFFNLTVRALGYPRTFIGVLDTVSIATAALLSLPLWWLATRAGPRRALLVSAALQTLGVSLIALLPSAPVLILAVALTGAAAVLFQVSAAPFMMRHSDAATRDHLFSANWGINIGLAGVASLIAGHLPALLGGWLGVGPETPLAYRATFGVAALGLVLAFVPLALLRRHDSAPPARVAPRAAPGSAAAQHDRPPALRLVAWLPAALRERLPPALLRLLARPWSLMRLLISPLLISFGAALLIRYLDLFFKETYAIPDSTLGAIFAGFGIATGMATLCAPLLSQRIGAIQTVALTQVLSIPFLLTLGLTPALALAAGAALIRQALFNMGSPLYDAFALAQVEEEARPIVIGLINGAYTAGYLVAPLISTTIQARYGFAPLFIATSTFYSLAAIANYLLFIRPLRRQTTATRRETPSAIDA
ncbi:MFS transporter [Kallotenue papyrolyticum]|uniref:MFS transporter n=1 Tax=Kallotenue papyrolyticum TaxID=1325125 RepID=UPI000492B1C2|nr:MFS transporter [Kallotenue papyrolyticum]